MVSGECGLALLVVSGIARFARYDYSAKQDSHRRAGTALLRAGKPLVPQHARPLSVFLLSQLWALVRLSVGRPRHIEKKEQAAGICSKRAA